MIVPYANFRFRLKWDNSYIAGFSKVVGLARSVPPVIHRAGDVPVRPRLPGETDYEQITLLRGVTYDSAFEQSANKVWTYNNESQATPGTSLADFRKDVSLEVFNEAGQRVLTYTIFRCWPSEFTATPELDGSGNAVAISSLILQNEGWTHDESAG